MFTYLFELLPLALPRFIVVTSLLIVVFAWFTQRRYQQTLFKRLGIPYVEPHWLYGNLHDLRNSKELETTVVEKWIKTHGKVVGFYVGGLPNLIISDLDMVHAVLVTESRNFINRPLLAIRAEPVVNTVVGLRDERWKTVRKVLTHTFSAVKMKPMIAHMNEKMDILLSYVEKISQDQDVEWFSLYQGLSLDVISKCAFAMETNCLLLQDDDPFFHAVRQFLKFAMNRAVLVAQYVPLLAEFMTIANNYWAKSGKATQMIVAHLKEAIAKRRSNPMERKIDALQLMLDASENTKTPIKGLTSANGKGILTDEEIIANAWVFLLGGYETTASALTFTTYHLSLHPEVQEKLYQEICEHVTDPKNYVSYDEVMKLTYLEQVLCETLRMYPPVVSFMTRETKETITINGTTILKGTTVSIPVWYIHHNPDYWPEPYKFDPDRFSSDSAAHQKRHPMAFLPFGSGPRNCIGMRFGKMETKLALIRVLASFRLEPCKETPDPLTFSIPTVTIHPNEKIFVKVTKRD